MVTKAGTGMPLRTARSLRTAARVALVSALAVLVARSVVLAGRPVSNHDPVAAGGADPRGGATAPVRFIATADTRSDGENNGVNVEILGEIVQATIDEAVDFILFPGDLVIGSIDPSVLESQLTTWRDTVQPLYDAGIGVYPVRGNHEVRGSDLTGQKAAWDNVFSGPYALPGNGPSGEENITFSFTRESVLIVGLDQYVAIHRVNQMWLDAQLVANIQPHVFVYGHEPAFKINHWDCLHLYPTERNAFWYSIEDVGGRTYFSGHDHFYDHARLDDGDGNPDNDVHQLVISGGGAPFHPDGVYDGDNGPWTPQRVYHEAEYGYLLVEIDGLTATLTWKHRTSPGVFESSGDVFTYTIDLDPPNAPTNLTATMVSATQIDLFWTDNSDNETGFEVESSTNGVGGPFVLLDTVGADTTTYADTGLSPATEYCYRVRAINLAGPSPYTGVACATTLGTECVTAPECDDDNLCTDDACVLGLCVYDFNTNGCDDDDACTTNDTCAGGTCVGGPMLECDNGQFCDGVEWCDPLLGCQAGTPIDCDDSVGCTVDSCDEVDDVCVNTPNNGLCGNGQFCDGIETCDPLLDCQAGTPVDCADGVGCTVDSCDEANDTCVNAASNGLCDDTLFCNGVETCDPLLDCQAGTPVDCADGVGCTVDSCDEVNDTCVNAASDGLCDDTLFCNGVETCDPLLDCQVGTPVDCNDGVGCTVDTCDEANDTCVNAASNGLCDNGQFCDGIETCDPLLDCQVGTPVDCDDGVGCTVDWCDEVNDTCVNAASNGLCDDSNPCTDDTCDPALGCQYANNTDPCDDGDPCNGTDVCSNGICVSRLDPADDCNTNGILDNCDINEGTSQDCNANVVPDECDISAGTSADNNGNGIPDECELPVWFVDDDAAGGGDGLAWTTAFNDLQDALAVAAAGDQIWVAGGTYTPTGSGGGRTATFQLISDVVLYGGYAGYGQPNPNERDLTLYETVLSGDLNRDDGSGGNNGENSYHVVTGSDTDETAVLDGFTISGGHANGPVNPNIHDGGAGMFNGDGGPTVVQCTFTGNSANHGAGMCSIGNSSPLLIRCVFDGNTAITFGGGIVNYSGTSVVLTNCTFSGNSARYGGAVRNTGGSPTLTNCTLTGNSAEFAGGVSGYGASSPALTNCILWGNSASGQADESAQINGGSPVINYCCVQGWTGDLGGVGNIGDNPRLAVADGAHLLPGSPCINAGDDDAPNLTDLDLDGDDRVQQCRVDMGIDETSHFVDCQLNGVPDACDVAAGTSQDCNQNGIPDECDVSNSAHLDSFAAWLVCLTGPGGVLLEGCGDMDLDADGDVDLADFSVLQSFSTRSGTSQDCNTNSIPDECDVVAGTSPDCNWNDVPDECDLAAGTSPDCNRNDVPDECDVSGDAHLDDFSEWLPCFTGPDASLPGGCEDMDFDVDGDVDLADFAVMQTFPIASGASHDCNSNGTPDECEIHEGSTAPGGPFFCEVYCEPDSNSNGVPDECDECLSNTECDDEEPCTHDACVAGSCVFTPFAVPRIENLEVFYAARFADDADPSRSFLASGSPATNANVTNYVRGITGIRVFFDDIVGFAAAPHEAFTFEWTMDTGTMFSPVANAVTAITVTPTVEAGRTVVTITIDDDHVRRRWLKVTVDSAQVSVDGCELDGELSGNPVALPGGDGTPGGDAVLYLGNLPGDVNDDWKTTLTDAGLVRAQVNPFLPVPITNVYDVDKNGKVLLTDFGEVRTAVNPFFTLPVILP